MKARLLIVTLAALSVLGATAADAASRKKDRKVPRGPAPAIVQGAVPHGHGPYQVAPSFPPNRPAWARATECYTDEGYGRFTPCSISRDSF